MKIVFLEVCAKSETAIDAHVRNCRILCDRLKKNGHKVFLLFIDTIQYFKDTDCDVIIVSYASFYANFAEMDRIISENPKAKIFWLTNEYDIGPNSFLNKQAKIRPVDVIANYEKKIFSNARNQHCLNLNLLFLRDLERREKKYDICYYGTYRKDRAEYFRKYLNSSEIILSSSSKNFKKFQSIGCKFRPCEKFKWGGAKETLGLFRYSIYIEDKFTHSNFNNLANRFYEAISNHTVILFDRSCINTLRKSEIKDLDYSRFIVDSISLKDRDFERDLAIQQQWKTILYDEREKMLKEFERIITE